MFNIAHHQGNASQNHNETSPYTCQSGHRRKDNKYKCDLVSLTCGIKKIQQMRDYNKKEALADTENKLEVTSGERRGVT